MILCIKWLVVVFSTTLLPLPHTYPHMQASDRAVSWWLRLPVVCGASRHDTLLVVGRKESYAVYVPLPQPRPELARLALA